MKRLTPILSLALVSAIAGAQDTGIGDPDFPTLGNKGYKASHYLLKINFDPATNFLKGDVTMNAVATQNIGSLSLDFKGFDVAVVKVNGKTASFTRSDSKLTVDLGGQVKAGAALTVETIYTGKPSQYQSAALPTGFKAGWISYKGGAVAVCEPDMAHSWYPCNDHPLNKATFEIDLTTPEGYKGISNGIGTPVGAHTTKFVLDKPALTCMATVIVGKYATLKEPGPGGLPITNFVPLGEEAQYLQTLAALPKYMQYLSDRLGPFPFSNYGCVIVPKEVGQVCALMNGTAIETTTIPVFGGGADGSTLIHEMTHQWMGDCVSVTNWGDDIWWVEGFAQYSEWLLREFQGGKEAYNKQVTSTYNQVASAGKWLKPGHLETQDLFSERSYVGGALTFHALRVKLGDEKFFQTVREFIAKNRYGNASVKDWIEISSKISGQDMKPFFDTWLYGNDVPKLPK